MAYSVFISHSMNQEDLGIVYEVVRQAQARGVTCYIAERDWQFGESLPEKIERAIRAADHFIAFWTQGGAHSQYVNQEIGFARACGKPRILVVEKDVPVRGFDVEKEFLEMDRSDPRAAISALNDFLSSRKAAKESADADAEQKRTLAIVAGIVGLLLLFGSEK